MSRVAKENEVMQIGDFARRAGLSVRAVRYYEELGLIRPESHSIGGFRLYGVSNLKRIRVINFLKDLGLSLTEIRRILLAKKPSGGDRGTVQLLIGIFQDKLDLLDEKVSALVRMKSELAGALRILRDCESCGHTVLLDAIACGECSSLNPRDAVPDTFEVILQ